MTVYCIQDRFYFKVPGHFIPVKLITFWLSWSSKNYKPEVLAVKSDIENIKNFGKKVLQN